MFLVVLTVSAVSLTNLSPLPGGRGLSLNELKGYTPKAEHGREDDGH